MNIKIDIVYKEKNKKKKLKSKCKRRQCDGVNLVDFLRERGKEEHVRLSTYVGEDSFLFKTDVRTSKDMFFIVQHDAVLSNVVVKSTQQYIDPTFLDIRI